MQPRWDVDSVGNNVSANLCNCFSNIPEFMDRYLLSLLSPPSLSPGILSRGFCVGTWVAKLAL